MKKKKQGPKKGGVVHGPVIQVTGRETHHFIVCNLDLSSAMRDDRGRVMIFLSREQAQNLLLLPHGLALQR